MPFEKLYCQSKIDVMCCISVGEMVEDVIGVRISTASAGGRVSTITFLSEGYCDDEGGVSKRSLVPLF